MISEHKQTSIAQFMYKNLHLLGFENKQRVLNVAFRELIDNSLDACAKAKILPEINAEVSYLGNREYVLKYRDNGPAIVSTNLPNICCRLLYGDKFDSTGAFRGQQGIGLTALFLYAQKTTGKPVRVINKRQGLKPIEFILTIDLKTNRPIVHSKKTLPMDALPTETGIYFEFNFKASYVNTGKKATKHLLKQYALLNPNLLLNYIDPDKETHIFERYSTEILTMGVGNKLVPHHIEYGELKDLLKASPLTVLEFLNERCEADKFHTKKALSLLNFSPHLYTSQLNELELENFYSALAEGYSGLKPASGRIFLLGDIIISSVTENGKQYYDYNCTVSSRPRYYEGGILQVEASAFYGNEKLPKDQKIQLIRVANGSPLFYQQGSCVITKTVADHEWRSSKLTHTQGDLPKGSLLLIVHVSSTKIPYTTESKDSISDNGEIREAINECLRKISKGIRAYLVKLKAYDSRLEKEVVISSILPELKSVLAEVLGLVTPSTSIALNGKIMNTIVYRLIESSEDLTYEFYNPLDEEKAFNIAYYGHPELTRCILKPNQRITYVVKKNPELQKSNTRIVFNGLSPIEYHKLTSQHD